MQALSMTQVEFISGGGWSTNNQPDAYSKAISSSNANQIFANIAGGAVAGLLGGPGGVAIGIVGGVIASIPLVSEK